jgi:hypothetical protein
MKRISIAVALAGVIGLVVLASLASGSSTGTKLVAIHVRELETGVGPWIRVGKLVGKSGLTKGDYQVWDDPLVKPGTKQVIGHVTGTCLLVNPAVGLLNCPDVVYQLPDGQLNDQGIFSLTSTKPGYGAIVGGTGAYSGAGGEDKGTFVPPNSIDWTFWVIKR